MLHSGPLHSTQTQCLPQMPQRWQLAFSVLSWTSPYTWCFIHVGHGSLPFTKTPQIPTSPVSVRHKGNPSLHFQVNPFYPLNHSTSLSPQTYKPKQNPECFSAGASQFLFLTLTHKNDKEPKLRAQRFGFCIKGGGKKTSCPFKSGQQPQQNPKYRCSIVCRLHPLTDPAILWTRVSQKEL